jgi:predicted double-glycine peptidase
VSHPDRLRVTAPLPANLVFVPVVKQREDFSCGAAATLALLRYWRPDAYASVQEHALYDKLETSVERGTEPEPIVAFLRRIGLDAEYRHGSVTVAELERAVDAREPPIVDLQAWSDDTVEGRDRRDWRDTWDAGHYVLMVGYDVERLFFADPSTMAPDGYAFLRRAELDERWHDLAGDRDERIEHMAIFARGDAPRTPLATDAQPPPKSAIRMG